ncbi:MAG TPA: EAL domain-containing protein [Candidatus Limnocylindrales bacterium]|nr:EAL domain-containing protein [Candidatus Limnocylindrales bacterium]
MLEFLKKLLALPLTSMVRTLVVWGFIDLSKLEKELKSELIKGLTLMTPDNAQLYHSIQQELAEHKRTEEQLQQRIEQLQSIYHLNSATSRAEVLEEIYTEALNALQRTLKADRASVLLFDPDGIIRFKAWRGLSDNYRKAGEGHCPWSRHEKNPQPILVPDVEKEPSLQSLRPAILKEGIRALGFIPLVYQGQLLGKFMIYYNTLHEFTDEEVQLAQTIASHIAFAIERKRAEDALRESEERYALAARGANDGLWDWNLKTGEIYYSPRWKSMLGYEENEIKNSLEEWFSRVHPEDIENLKARIDLHLEGLTPFENEHRMKHKDGTYRWMLSRGLAVRDAEGKAYRMAGSQTDITDRKVAEMQLLHDAFHDALTGLPNRALFMNRLEHATERSKRRQNYQFAVLFLDLDRFKVVNDSLGHLAGDQLLVEIARRLVECLRPGDTVARLGGDEFAILLDGIESLNDAIRVSDRIQKELMSPFNLNGQEVCTTTSIGIALNTIGYIQPDDLLRDADIAMYRAKALGKARYAVFDAGMHTRAVELLHLEASLRRAIEQQEFRLYYQPILCLKSGKITGVEALLRWQHPQRGLISPGEFIPVAEETGLIVAIGEWVIQTACTQSKAWQDMGLPPLFVAINLSARQFQHQNLLELIKKILKETGMAAQTLKLEITESIAMRDLDFSIPILKELSAMGVQILIDDFGTCYSSLGYLNRFPINALKIDQSFVKDIPNNADNAAIIKAIIAMAHSLKLKVIAEGVETEEQLTFLRSQACDEIQGYLLSHPLPAEVFARLYPTFSL